MSPEVHHKRSTLPTRNQNDFSGSEDGRKKLNFRSINQGCTPGGMPDRQGNVFNDYNTGNSFTESLALFDDTRLKR